MSQNILENKIRERFEKQTRRKQFQLRLVRNWWLIAVLILGVYVGLPMAAPVLMEIGATGPANGIYDVYSFACHQFAFRSVFLFGDQVFYPREDAGVGGFDTFEARAPQSETFVEIYQNRFQNPEAISQQDVEAAVQVWDGDAQWTWAAREFRGDEELGYKMGLCQRDIAIYLTMVVAGLIFGLVKHRLRPVSLWLYVMLGVFPIAIDGFGQLLSYPPFEFWDPSETSPYFRILTGALFGLMNVWLAFPYLHRSFLENAESIEQDIEYYEHEMNELIQRTRSAEVSG